MRGYLFTDRDRERLRLWLKSGVEDDGTRMLFVGVRRSMDRIANDVELLVAVVRRLGAEGRMMGRARLPGGRARALDTPSTLNEIINVELSLLAHKTQERLTTALERTSDSQDRLSRTGHWLSFIGIAIALLQLIGIFIPH